MKGAAPEDPHPGKAGPRSILEKDGLVAAL